MIGRQIKCSDCGFGYISGIPDNISYHKKYPDKIVNGILARHVKSDKVIWKAGSFWITVVNYASPISQKKRAQETARIAHLDTPFDFAPYHANEPLDERNVHVFLLHHRTRIVGFSIIDRRSKIWKCPWEQYENRKPQELPHPPPIWSVGLIWVHKLHRKKGFAGQLVLEATSFLGTNIQSVGWYSPFTELGKAMVRRLCPEYIFIAK